jgi:transposase-like protein
VAGTAGTELIGIVNNRIESDHCHMKRRLLAMQGLRSARQHPAVIQ